MTVYVDDSMFPIWGGKFSHMVGDTTEELISMGSSIGIYAEKRLLEEEGTHSEHYMVSKSQRAAAIQVGAKEITNLEYWDYIAARRTFTEFTNEEKLEILEKQVEETRIIGSQGPKVTCVCGKHLLLRVMFRCLYCKIILCHQCAEVHFGKTVDEWHKENGTYPGHIATAVSKEGATAVKQKHYPIVAFLQNPWFKPGTNQTIITKYQNNPEYRRYVLALSKSGRNLYRAFGGLYGQIYWENANPEPAFDSHTVMPPKIEHIKSVVKQVAPHLVITFGTHARAGAEMARIETPVMSAQHPAYIKFTAEKLATFAYQVERRLMELQTAAGSYAEEKTGGWG